MAVVRVRGHGRGRQAADVEGAVEVHVEHQPPGVGIESEEGHVAVHARHLHGRVKGPLIAFHRRHQLLDRRPIADVAPVGHRGAAALPLPGRWRNAFTGGVVEGELLPLREVFARFPVAVLEKA